MLFRNLRLRCAGATVVMLVATGCATRYPLRDPTGDRFPSVAGQALDGQTVRFPDAVAGRPAVLLIAYDQDTQFDVDRWLLGLLQGKLQAPLYEMPTIPGAIPRLLAGTIDEGMRGGIPSEDWGSVVTVYDDADPIARFTGNDQRRRNTRVVVLNADGVVVFFHDRGYSARLVPQIIGLTTTASTAGPGD